MSYGDYVEQLTYLLFLKMADERTKPPYNQPSQIPDKYSWPSLLKKDGDDLFYHYRHLLEEFGKGKGMLGLIFTTAQNKFQDPVKLRRLIVDLLDKEDWCVSRLKPATDSNASCPPIPTERGHFSESFRNRQSISLGITGGEPPSDRSGATCDAEMAIKHDLGKAGGPERQVPPRSKAFGPRIYDDGLSPCWKTWPPRMHRFASWEIV